MCSYPGCKNVLVIDGNMKNRRDVCAATEAGFTEYMGLPGAIKTGCQQSPAYQSKVCYEHSLRVGSLTHTEDEQQLSIPRENIVGLIIGKKPSRRGTYYQVQFFFIEHTYVHVKYLLRDLVLWYITRTNVY